MDVDSNESKNATEMDVSLDGENLELNQQVKEFCLVVSLLRKVAEEMVSVKRSDPSLNKSETVTTLTALRGRVHMLFLELKQLNRTISFLGQSMKACVQTVKIAQAPINLDLQGIVYERSHFVKEINKCRDFKTAADDIVLINEQEFTHTLQRERQQDSSQDPAAAASSSPLSFLSPSPSNAHEWMLARLKHEIKSRQALLGELDKLKGTRAELDQKMKAHNDFMNSLTKQVKNLFADATKVQAQLPGSAMLLPSHPKSFFLPKPLYNLYNILLCYQGYYDPSIQIKIMGDASANEIVESSNTNSFNNSNNNNNTISNGGSNNSNNEDVVMHTSEKNSKSTTSVTAITASTSATTSASAAPTTTSASNSLDVQPHSLAITLTTTFIDKTEVAFLFRYLLPLNIVTVSHTGRGSWDSLMINLVPQDTGEDLPNNFTSMFSSSSSQPQTAKLDTKKFGKPFRWLQTLCGLHFTPPEGIPSPRSFNIASLLARLRHRAAIRVSLQKQFNQLQKKLFPPENVLDEFGVMAVKPKPVLTRWVKARAEDFFKLDNLESKQTASEWYQVCAEYYQFAFAKGAVTLEGVVEISPEYPVRPPSFRLFFTKGVSDKGLVPNPLVKSTANSDALTLSMTKGTSSEFSNDLFDIQVEVNSNFPRPLREIAEGEEKGDMFLLSFQLKKIMVCFDLLSAAADKSSQLSFSQLIRGRDRRRPFSYNSKDQTYRHWSL